MPMVCRNIALTGAGIRTAVRAIQRQDRFFETIKRKYDQSDAEGFPPALLTYLEQSQTGKEALYGGLYALLLMNRLTTQVHLGWMQERFFQQAEGAFQLHLQNIRVMFPARAETLEKIHHQIRDKGELIRELRRLERQVSSPAAEDVPQRAVSSREMLVEQLQSAVTLLSLTTKSQKLERLWQREGLTETLAEILHTAVVSDRQENQLSVAAVPTARSEAERELVSAAQGQEGTPASAAGQPLSVESLTTLISGVMEELDEETWEQLRQQHILPEEIHTRQAWQRWLADETHLIPAAEITHRVLTTQKERYEQTHAEILRETARQLEGMFYRLGEDQADEVIEVLSREAENRRQAERFLNTLPPEESDDAEAWLLRLFSVSDHVERRRAWETLISSIPSLPAEKVAGAPAEQLLKTLLHTLERQESTQKLLAQQEISSEFTGLLDLLAQAEQGFSAALAQLDPWLVPAEQERQAQQELAAYLEWQEDDRQRIRERGDTAQEQDAILLEHARSLVHTRSFEAATRVLSFLELFRQADGTPAETWLHRLFEEPEGAVRRQSWEQFRSTLREDVTTWLEGPKTESQQTIQTVARELLEKMDRVFQEDHASLHTVEEIDHWLTTTVEQQILRRDADDPHRAQERAGQASIPVSPEIWDLSVSLLTLSEQLVLSHRESLRTVMESLGAEKEGAAGRDPMQRLTDGVEEDSLRAPASQQEHADGKRWEESLNHWQTRSPKETLLRQAQKPLPAELRRQEQTVLTLARTIAEELERHTKQVQRTERNPKGFAETATAEAAGWVYEQLRLSAETELLRLSESAGAALVAVTEEILPSAFRRREPTAPALEKGPDAEMVQEVEQQALTKFFSLIREDNLPAAKALLRELLNRQVLVAAESEADMSSALPVTAAVPLLREQLLRRTLEQIRTQGERGSLSEQTETVSLGMAQPEQTLGQPGQREEHPLTEEVPEVSAPALTPLEQRTAAVSEQLWERVWAQFSEVLRREPTQEEAERQTAAAFEQIVTQTVTQAAHQITRQVTEKELLELQEQTGGPWPGEVPEQVFRQTFRREAEQALERVSEQMGQILAETLREETVVREAVLREQTAPLAEEQLRRVEQVLRAESRREQEEQTGTKPPLGAGLLGGPEENRYREIERTTADLKLAKPENAPLRRGQEPAQTSYRELVQELTQVQQRTARSLDQVQETLHEEMTQRISGLRQEMEKQTEAIGRLRQETQVFTTQYSLKKITDHMMKELGKRSVIERMRRGQ